MSMWWSLHLRREAASVPLARRFLLGTMESAGVDPDISFDLSVALSEACANAVEHGGAHGGPDDAGKIWDAWEEPSSTACGQYRVTAYLDGEKCRIEVSDSGPGFPARRTLRDAAQQQHDPYQQEPQQYELRQFQSQQAAHPPLAAESGRGLCLIEQLADHVHFGNRPGRGGAVVSFDKILKWREDALLMVS
ncbi:MULTISPECIES: ATP-binding protein [unclassified Streptomyces]|uniref:ATP-binding protein n=1 Tax=unclassified Streptomyces TaxID=2593676 RepID=UPI000F47629D|nr:MULTISPECIES: ATP-binding protein [unclassified Streptomyces]MCX4771198.1 ATP-binding protein [Streptomyces sp. NBC_01285]ROQ81459.1 serine/threonine-protein kinase RsbW [Streptomyces sp. CEV 2-1]